MTEPDTEYDGAVTGALLRNDQAVIDTALASAEPTVLAPGRVTAFVVPSAGRLATVDLDTDEHRDRPRRLRGTTIVRSEEALVLLAEKWGAETDRIVYADAVTRQVVAVLNDDVDPDTPGWRDRLVSLELVHTPEWQRWKAKDGQLMPQTAFAEHIEACLEDVRSPEGGVMLELAQSLEATTQVTWRSQVRLSSGQRTFAYSEDGEARAGRDGNTIEVPEKFTLALTPWAGRDSKPFGVEARLRYRVTSQGLQLGYQLIDTERILLAAFEEDVVTPIREAGLTVVNGRP